MSMMNRQKVCTIDCKPIPDSYNKLSFVDDVVDGKIVKRSEYKRSSVKDTYGDMQSSEFSIQNYIALGVTDSLKVGVFANNDIDGFSSALESAMNAVDNLKPAA